MKSTMNLTSVLHIPMESEGVRESAQRLVHITDAYHKVPDFRSLADSDPVAALARFDVEVMPDTEVRFVEDTDDTFHFVLPPDFNANLGDEVLNMVAGGKTQKTSRMIINPPSCGCGASCLDVWTTRGGSGCWEGGS